MEKKNFFKKTFGAAAAILLVPVAVFGAACGGDVADDAFVHSHNYVWADNGDGTHKQHCSVVGCDTPDKSAGNHDFANGNCVCGKEKPAETPKHVHAYDTAWKSDDSYHWHECKNVGCDAKIKDKAVHDFTSGDCVCGKAHAHKLTHVDAVSATCTEDGVKEYRSCSVCNKKFGDANGTNEITNIVITKTGHTEVDDPAVAATCTTPGKTAGKHCSVCNTVTVAQEDIPVAAHRYSTQLTFNDTHHWYACEATDCTAKDAYAAHDFTSGNCACGKEKYTVDLKFELDDSGNSYKVSKGTTTDTEIIIPSTYGGKPVTSIDTTAFYDYSGLTSVVIPDSVTSIGIRAFSGCVNLTSINLPANLQSTGYEAFDRCGKITSVTIPDSLTDIGYDTFRGCSSLRYTESGNGLYLGNAANQYLWLMGVKSKDIESCTINTAAKYIHSNAFEYCVNLYSLKIPDNITYVGYNAFGNCNLTIYCEAASKPSGWDSEWNYSSLPVVWDSNNDDGKDANGYVYGIIDGVRYKLKDGKGIAVGIGQASNVKSVTIKSSVVHRGDTYSVDTIGEKAFYQSSLETITISDGIKTIESQAFGNCASLTSVTISNTVETLGAAVFSKCYELTSVTIPSSVTSVGYNVTNSCGTLVVLCEATAQPASWTTSWNTGACPVIWDCKTNKKDAQGYEYDKIDGVRYSLKDGVATVIGQSKNITTAVIPSSVMSGGTSYEVKSIASYAFYECAKLNSVTIGDKVTSIGEQAFAECGGLESIIIPSNVTTMGSYAFLNCSSLSIKCESASQPYAWSNTGWNDGRPVEWGYGAG